METVRKEITKVIVKEGADGAAAQREEIEQNIDAVSPEEDPALQPPPVLLHFVGETNPKVFRAEPSSSSLNEGDVFILEAKNKMYFWVGKDCSEDKKNVSFELCEKISKCKTRETHPSIVFPQQNEEAEREFWKMLGGKPDRINQCLDINLGELEDARFSLFKISDESGTMKTTAIKERPLYKSHLDTKDIFLLEEDLQIYIWTGSNSNTAERKNAARIG